MSERMKFTDAPVLMDFRKETTKNPENNCTYYNKMCLRKLAVANKKPVMTIEAQHEGIAQTEGLKIDSERFNELGAVLEVAEEARVILIHNLHVAHGLMNGTQGTIKRVVYKQDGHPNHENPDLRFPECIIVDFPEYEGPAFFDDENQRTWCPIFPREICDPESKDIKRRQFPLVLAWALTPWKAQGLTLKKVVVKLSRAIMEPGLLFVALSRVEHPDNLMLDDDFPDYCSILRQKRNDTFQKRHAWEKTLEVFFRKQFVSI